MSGLWRSPSVCECFQLGRLPPHGQRAAANSPFRPSEAFRKRPLSGSEDPVLILARFNQQAVTLMFTSLAHEARGIIRESSNT